MRSARAGKASPRVLRRMAAALAICAATGPLAASLPAVEAQASEIFVVNFASDRARAAKGRLIKLMQSRVDGRRAFSVVNAATGVPLVAVIGRMSSAQVRGVKEAIPETVEGFYRTAGDAASPNDATDWVTALDGATDVLRASSAAGDRVDVYLIDMPYHVDAEHDFREGYPNDGFITLDDSRFADLPTASDRDLKVHTLFSRPFERHAERFQRFTALLTSQRLGGELASFNALSEVGRLPALDIAGTADAAATFSDVIVQREPECPHVDRESVRRVPGGRIAVTVSNPCRANSMVELIHNGGRVQMAADETGKVEFVLDAIAGPNTLGLVGLGNEVVSLRDVEVEPFPDLLTATVTAGTANIVGENTLRREGEVVTIAHADGRTWSVPVVDDRFTLADIPLDEGENRFTVSGPRGGPAQPLLVSNEPTCRHRANIAQENGTAQIVIQDSCLRNVALELDYEGETYSLELDGNGQGKLDLSLTQRVNTVTYDLRGENRALEIPFIDIESTVKITLRWNDRVDLDLHVREGQSGKVVRHNNRQEAGKLDIDEFGRSAGLKEENYSLPASAVGSLEQLNASVQFYTRASNGSDGKLAARYCAGGKADTVPFTVTILNRGRETTTQHTFLSADCNAKPSGGAIWQTIEPIALR